ncbi:MAG: hypothetical protein ACTHOC_09515 [Luteimonas sp.]
MTIRILPLPTVATALLLVASATSVAARKSEPLLDQAVHSMFVRGSIDVGPDGKVERSSIDDAEAYSPPIREMLDRVIPQWTFRPGAGDAAAQSVHSPMYLRLQANPAGDGQFKVDIASAAFGARSGRLPSDSLSSARMGPPDYPHDELRAQVGAQVIAAIKVRRDGSVEDVVIEQTNLAQTGTKRAMAQWRKDFEKAVVAAARQWRFVPPTTGADASRSYWSVRIPSIFTAGPGASSAGQWRTFVPGPQHPVPWATEEEQALAAGTLDALPGSGVFPLKPALQLLTPLNAG